MVFKYRVQWGAEDNNVQNGIYGIQGVLEQLEHCCHGTCTSWEEEMWCEISIGDWLEQVVRLRVGQTVYVPYQGEGLVPDILMITAVEGENE